MRLVQPHHAAVERIPTPTDLHPPRGEEADRLQGDVHSVAGEHSPAPSSGHRRHQDQGRWSTGDQRLTLELHPPGLGVPERGDLHRVAISVRVRRACELEARSRHPDRAESPRAIASETVVTAQEARGTWHRSAAACLEGPPRRRTRSPRTHLGDGHDRHHLRRRVERVVPALPPEPARPDRQRVGRREPVQVHRPHLAGVGAERRDAIRTGNRGW